MIHKWVGTRVAILCALLALSRPARSDATPEQEFDAGMAEVEMLLGREWWRQGQRALKVLLEQHVKRNYVKFRRLEIEDLARRLAFGRANPPVRARDVLSGKVLSYSGSSGKLRIQYTPETAGDFEVVRGSLMVLPVRFKGPFKVKIEGKHYPRDAAACPQVLVGMEPDPKTLVPQAWRIAFGSRPQVQGRRKTWMPVEFIHYDGDKQKVVRKSEKYPAKPGARYRIDIRMMKTKVTAAVNGISVGQARKPSTIFGRIAFKAPTWTRVRVEGMIETAWIQGKIDKIVQQNLKEFRKDYDPRDVLPKWLLASKVKPRPYVSRGELLYPPTISKTERDHLGGIYRSIDVGDLLGAALALKTVPEDALGPASRAFADARILFALGGHEEALERIGTCRTAMPDFVGAQLLEARVLAALGRWDDALRTFEGVMEAHPAIPPIYVTAAETALRRGHPEAVALFARRASSHRASSPGLEAFRRAALKADRGPTWPRCFDHASEHYHVFSDIDTATCCEAARTLEMANTCFHRTLPFTQPEDARRFKVYLFSGRGGFDTYQKDLGVLGSRLPPMVAGLYSTWLKQLLIWNLPRRDAMMRTVRHEGFHQYLDRFLASPPVWFNEGLAEYYEAGEPVAGTLRLGRVEPNHVALLVGQERMPLDAFLHLSPKAFYEAAPESYAQAWAFIHMLRRGGRKPKQRFEKFVENLKTMPPYAAMEDAFPAKDIPALDRALTRHLEKLAKP